MMTRKDFRLIAAVLKQAKPNIATYAGTDTKAFQEWQLIVHGLTSALAQTNPQFNALKFAAACSGPTEDEMASHSADH